MNTNTSMDSALRNAVESNTKRKELVWVKASLIKQ